MSALYGTPMRMEAAESLIVKNRARWTRERFDRLVELGAFDGGERVELVRGELVAMSKQGVPHGNVIETLTELLVPRLVGRARVRVQLPFIIDDESELMPDLAIVDKALPRSEHPASAFLIIEVADSSLRYDRIVKAPLYASAGVPEYWLVDTTREHIELFSALKRGTYGRTAKVAGGSLPIPGFPGVEIRVADLFA
jgi:Uma2 family endonuclease